MGGMRYFFVAAGWLGPPLAAPLPPSQRRKRVCVGVIIAMLVALAPPVGPMMGRWLCLGGLLLLAYSFAADCLRLAARARGDAPAPGCRNHGEWEWSGIRPQSPRPEPQPRSP